MDAILNQKGETTMTTQKNRLAALVATAALLAAALPAAAQGAMTDSDRFVTRALDNNGSTVPHRPESDIYFPWR
jgi:hypothetical protein